MRFIDRLPTGRRDRRPRSSRNADPTAPDLQSTTRQVGDAAAAGETSAGSFLDESLDDPLAHPLARLGVRLSRASSVLAIIPHFQCEPWLGDCLDSLARQTHPLDGIVVVDDCSDDPPVATVKHFPAVTLLTSTENVGPYRISQAVIDNTGYDAYCFQDADDWSAPNRLELLLAEAERTGAEQVGCQGHRLICLEGEVVPLTFPLDVNAALTKRPTNHALMHPSSIVSRDLVMRVGGYATGLRFGADTEFEHRAGFVARLVNVPHFAYVVRNRAGSLTSSPETGLQSPQRMELRRVEFERTLRNVELVAEGQEPDLSPLATADPASLVYITGPKLRSATGGIWPA